MRPKKCHRKSYPSCAPVSVTSQLSTALRRRSARRPAMMARLPVGTAEAQRTATMSSSATLDSISTRTSGNVRAQARKHPHALPLPGDDIRIHASTGVDLGTPEMESEVLRPQAGATPDARQHARADLLVVVKCEDKVGPPFARQRAVGPRLPLHGPASPEQCSQDPAGLGRGPAAHAASNETVSSSGGASPCSKRSAMTRSAKAWTRAIA